MPAPKRIPRNEHRSITALLREALPQESAEDAMRRKCRDYVIHAKSLGWSGPRFDPRFLASALGIKVEEMPAPWDGDGRIFPRAGRTVIQYRPDQVQERQWFTICHEIAHTCFPDFARFVHHYNADAEEGTASHRRFERLCNVGAGELLMPHEEFQADVVSKKVCLQEICDLGTRYGSSVDAAVRRWLDFTAHPCAVAFLSDQPFENFTAVPGRFRVRWFWPAKTFRSYLRSGTLLPGSACLQSAQLQEHGFASAVKETWWINQQPRQWYVEGLRLPPIPENPAYPCLMALLHSRQQR